MSDDLLLGNHSDSEDETYLHLPFFRQAPARLIQRGRLGARLGVNRGTTTTNPTRARATTRERQHSLASLSDNNNDDDDDDDDEDDDDNADDNGDDQSMESARSHSTAHSQADDTKEPEDVPQEELVWDLLTTEVTDFVEAKRDKLTVTYTGKAATQNDVGAVRTTHPIPRNQLIFYYEIKIVEVGENKHFAIGLSDVSFRLNRQPGWEQGSYGYHCDGRKFCESTRGENFSEQYGVGDVVGCGIIYSTRDVFFTKNGKYLGVAFPNIPLELVLHATVGLHSKGARITANFGTEPFAFDIQKLIAQERSKHDREVAQHSVSYSTTHAIVASYFLHHGLAQSLHAFVSRVNPQTHEQQKQAHQQHQQHQHAPHSQSVESVRGEWEAIAAVCESSVDDLRVLLKTLAQRNQLRVLAMEHKSLEILALLKHRFSQCFVGELPTDDKMRHVFFHASVQHFLGVVCSGNVEEAVLFARASIAPLCASLDQSELNILRDAMSTVAFSDPRQSPGAHLLLPAFSFSLADKLNAFVLQFHGYDAGSVLERLISQLVVAQDTLRHVNGNTGEAFQLHSYIKQPHSSKALE